MAAAPREAYPDIKLHCVGRLQSNKAAEALQLSRSIHSLDRASLLDALDREAGKQGPPPSLSTSRSTSASEEQKGGCRDRRVAGELGRAAVRGSPLPLAGLMAIPSAWGRARRPFSPCWQSSRGGMTSPGLSMGMFCRFQERGDARRDRGPRRHRPVRGCSRPWTPSSSISTACCSRANMRATATSPDFLSKRGHPTTVQQAMDNFMGLAGPEFLAAIERWIGGPIPADFERERHAADERMIRDGIAEVDGAVRFVRSLDPALPKAVASSSSRLMGRAPSGASRDSPSVRRLPVQRPDRRRARQARARPLLARGRPPVRADRGTGDRRRFAGGRGRGRCLGSHRHRAGRRPSLRRRSC